MQFQKKQQLLEKQRKWKPRRSNRFWEIGKCLAFDISLGQWPSLFAYFEIGAKINETGID